MFSRQIFEYICIAEFKYTTNGNTNIDKEETIFIH